MIDAAYIHLWGKRVGAIAWDTATHLGSFEFETSFISQNLDLAPLKMPISQARGRVFSFPELSQSNTFKGLPGLLSDVLPDKYGNTLINAWLAQQGRPTNSLNPVEILCFIGKRGMGALEFEPAEPQAGAASTKIEMNHLVHIAQEIMLGRKEFQKRKNNQWNPTIFPVVIMHC